MISVEENAINRQHVMDLWRLGPLVASVLPTVNEEYWNTMAEVWDVPTDIARTQLRANCEYYDNTSSMLIDLSAIPLDSLDLDGGGRGFCERFDFICHNLRTCQAWEDKSIMEEIGDEAMKAVLPQILKNIGVYDGM
jgi:hypothetical protein